jgi:hypothetical protein
MPRPKVFTIGLSAADREFLSKLTVTGMHPARMIIRAGCCWSWTRTPAR